MHWRGYNFWVIQRPLLFKNVAQRFLPFFVMKPIFSTINTFFLNALSYNFTCNVIKPRNELYCGRAHINLLHWTAFTRAQREHSFRIDQINMCTLACFASIYPDRLHLAASTVIACQDNLRSAHARHSYSYCCKFAVIVMFIPSQSHSSLHPAIPHTQITIFIRFYLPTAHNTGVRINMPE